MTAAATHHLPLYPELRGCTAPSTERILEIFADLARHELYHDGHHIQTFQPEINPLQRQVLDLLGVPTSAYTPPLTDPRWGAISPARSAQSQPDGNRRGYP